jgi:hypothetical protein
MRDRLKQNSRNIWSFIQLPAVLWILIRIKVQTRIRIRIKVKKVEALEVFLALKDPNLGKSEWYR